MTKKVIVTGGAGFIGSHSVDRLLRDGHEVIVIDNFSTGRPQNLDHHRNNKNLKLIKEDIVNHESILPLFEDVDWVFHYAALGDIVPSIVKPKEYFNSNVNGTFSVLEASRKYGIKRFFYAASSSCYGIPDVYPTPETSEIRPMYPYALTKRLGEEMVLHWGQVYKLPVVSLRFFNAYGPRSRTSGTYGAVMGVFMKQKLANKPFTIVGDGEQTRDFTYVVDVVDACVSAVESDVCGDYFNVGSGGTYSINNLVDLLGGGEKTYIPKRPGEPDCTFADISKIKSIIGWSPKTSFEDGMKEVVKNIEYWKDAPLWTPDSIADATKEWFEYLK
jgi:UDP-glucose 4-epimerase